MQSHIRPISGCVLGKKSLQQQDNGNWLRNYFAQAYFRVMLSQTPLMKKLIDEILCFDGYDHTIIFVSTDKLLKSIFA